MPRPRNPEKKQMKRRTGEFQGRISKAEQQFNELMRNKRFGEALVKAEQIYNATGQRSHIDVLTAAYALAEELEKSGNFAKKSQVLERAAKILEEKFPRVKSEEKKTLSKTIFVWLNQAADSAELAGNKKRSIQLRLKAVEFAFKRKNNADKEKNSK